jgi:UTP--glucose-1-phosphate uridylyltransferase
MDLKAPPVRKAVIPAAGMGTRFLPATKAQPKEMLPIVDTPAIQFVVEEAVRAGLTDILIIIGRGKRSIEDHFDRAVELEAFLEEKGKLEELDQIRRIADMANIHYIRQKEAAGLGHAVAAAQDHVNGEPFAVLLGDDLIHESVPLLSDMLRTSTERRASVVAAMEVSEKEIGFYGCITPEPIDEHLSRVLEIVEKPPPGEAASNLAVIGRYVFTSDIFDALAETKPGRGGEIQLTDAINLLAHRETVYSYSFDRGRFDVGNKLDYLKATVEFALERKDLGPDLREYLSQVAKREAEEIDMNGSSPR